MDEKAIVMSGPPEASGSPTGDGDDGLCRGRCLLLILLLILVSLASFVALMFMPGLLSTYEDWGDLQFTSERWKAVDAKVPGNPRGAMLSDLIETHQLVGLTRDEIKALLGPPDHISGGSDWQYYLGAYSGFQVDEDILVIEFNGGERVTAWRVRAS